MAVTTRDPGELTPLLAAKLRAPALHPGWHERERVSARLDEAVLDATRLAILSAPAGYGKTVALAGWLASRRLPHAWLTLDAGDDDAVRFVRHLVASLTTVRPGLGASTLTLVSTGATVSPEVVAGTLLEEIAASDDAFVLAIDELHAVTSARTLQIVRFLVEHAPPFLHPVVLTRVEPDLPLARLRATGRLLEIGPDDLRFTLSEAAAYVTDAAGIKLSDAQFGRLLERTEGWAAGLQLAAVLLRGRPDPAAVIDAFHGSHRYVLDYLAGEVVDGIDPPLREFLVRTSIPDRFTVELARELTGPDAAALLERAEEANLFVTPIDLERRWFRYHQLFADYLRTQVPVEEAAELRGRIVRYLEREGLRREAIDAALAADGQRDALRLVREEARATFDAGELTTLLAWLRRLSRGAIEADAELAGLGAWSLFLTGDLATAREWAVSGLARQDPAAPDGRLLIAAAIVAVMADAATETAEELVVQALEVLGDDPFFRSQALLTLGEVRLSQGRLRDAVETMSEALELARRSGQPMAVFPIAYLLATAMNAVGRRSEAEGLCHALIAEYSDSHGRPFPIAGFARIALGTTLYEANRLADARREIERGFEDAEVVGFSRFMLGQAAGFLAVVRAATGAPDLARQATESGGRYARALGMTPAVPQSPALDAQLALGRGDLDAAAAWAEAELAAPARGADLIPRVRFVRDTALARILLALQRPEEALGVLENYERVAEDASAVAFLVTVSVLEAVAHQQAGHAADARQCVERAIDLAAPSGYVRRLVEDGRPVASLMAAERSRGPELVDAVLAGLGEAERGAPRVPAVRGEAGPVETLTARELDVLRLMAQGRSNAAIADELVVSLATAKWHVSHVLAKLGAANRTDALVRAQRLGLV